MRRLRQVRKEKGYTIKRLSAETGIAVSTIGNYETGKYPMSDARLSRIADTLGVKSADIEQHVVRESSAEYGSDPWLQPGWSGFNTETLEGMLNACREMRDWSAVAALAHELQRRTAKSEDNQTGKTKGD